MLGSERAGAEFVVLRPPSTDGLGGNSPLVSATRPSCKNALARTRNKTRLAVCDDPSGESRKNSRPDIFPEPNPAKVGKCIGPRRPIFRFRSSNPFRSRSDASELVYLKNFTPKTAGYKKFNTRDFLSDGENYLKALAW